MTPMQLVNAFTNSLRVKFSSVKFVVFRSYSTRHIASNSIFMPQNLNKFWHVYCHLPCYHIPP